MDCLYSDDMQQLNKYESIKKNIIQAKQNNIDLLFEIASVNQDFNTMVTVINKSLLPQQQPNNYLTEEEIVTIKKQTNNDLDTFITCLNDIIRYDDNCLSDTPEIVSKLQDKMFGYDLQSLIENGKDLDGVIKIINLFKKGGKRKSCKKPCKKPYKKSCKKPYKKSCKKPYKKNKKSCSKKLFRHKTRNTINRL